MSQYGTYAERQNEIAERKAGVFRATKGMIVEGVMREDYNEQASSTTVKNPNGHRSPHNPNTPYTNEHHAYNPASQQAASNVERWGNGPVAQPNAAALFEQKLAAEKRK